MKINYLLRFGWAIHVVFLPSPRKIVGMIPRGRMLVWYQGKDCWYDTKGKIAGMIPRGRLIRALSEYMSFLWNGKSLSHWYFVSSLKLLLSVAGIPKERFKSHSFPIGAATSCVSKGASDAQIRQLGRWHSDAFKRHIRSPDPLQQRHSATSLEVAM